MGQKALDKVREIRHAYRMASQPFDPWQEVSLVTFTIRLTPLMRQQLYRRLHQGLYQRLAATGQAYSWTTRHRRGHDGERCGAYVGLGMEHETFSEDL